MNEAHQKLIAAAMAARAAALAPYSRFRVGASLLTAEGTIISGANMESASYGLSCCAERVALFKALSEGHRSFTTIAVAAPGAPAPCGACRQWLAEHAKGATVILVDLSAPDNPVFTTVTELLPRPFTGDSLAAPPSAG